MAKLKVGCLVQSKKTLANRAAHVGMGGREAGRGQWGQRTELESHWIYCVFQGVPWWSSD